MRSLVYQGPGELAVQTLPDPEPGRGELSIEVEAVGICGSDVHGYLGETGRRTPGMTMGHEACGRVLALGEGLAGFAEGERVTFNPVIGCGSCPDCVAGRTNRCASRRVIGVDAPYRGAFSERMLLPAANVLPVSADVGVGAVLIEPLAVALHAVARAEIVPGAAVAVLGAGMIGLGCAWAALQAGAEIVYLTDFDVAKTDLGERLGARPVRLGEQSLAEALAQDGREHVDRVVDAVGLPATLQQALDAVARGGIVSLVGMRVPHLDFAAYSLTADERTVVGCICYTTDEFAAAVAMVGERRLDPFLFIDRQVSLDKASDAFALLAAGAPGQIKTVVLPNG